SAGQATAGFSVTLTDNQPAATAGQFCWTFAGASSVQGLQQALSSGPCATGTATINVPPGAAGVPILYKPVFIGTINIGVANLGAAVAASGLVVNAGAGNNVQVVATGTVVVTGLPATVAAGSRVSFVATASIPPSANLILQFVDGCATVGGTFSPPSL